MESIVQDLRYAARNLSRSPLFTGVAVLTLALGIGVNATLFNLVDSVLWRPLPMESPEELLEIFNTEATSDALYGTHSYLDYEDLQAQNEVLTGLAGHSKMLAQLSHGGRSEFVVGELVTGNYFQVLGLSAARGRTLLPEDDRLRESSPVAVLGHSFWEKRFGADPEILGSSLRLNGRAYTVVGVMPPTFTGTVAGLSSSLWVPVAQVDHVEPAGLIDTKGPGGADSRLEDRGYRWMFLTGRRSSDLGVEQVEAQLQTVMARLAQQYPETNEGRTLTLVPSEKVRLHPSIDRALGPVGIGLLSVVALVLLIACANLANMVLSRAMTRRREVAVRLALGAGRGRLLRQFLTESLVLSLLGGVVALVLAGWTTRLLLAYQPPVPFALDLDVHFDGRAAAFTLLLSVLTSLFIGLLPAFQASRPELVPALKGDSGEARGGRLGLRQVLVVGQVAVSLMLLIAAALLTRGFFHARSVDVGFEPDKVAMLWTHPGLLGHEREQAEPFYRRLLDDVRGISGVESASLASRLPFTLNEHWAKIVVEGHQRTAEDPGFVFDSTDVEPDYFATMGLELVAGRDFTAQDVAGAPRVAVINETLAERFWPPGDAVGRSFRLATASGARVEVVGVVRDHKVGSVAESPTPLLHFARQQRYHTSANLVVRAAPGVEAATLLPVLREAVTKHDAAMPIANAGTLAESLAVKLYPVRLGALLLGVFGLLALFLASVGLYGVIAFSVNQRHREIGLRMALGARPGDVRSMVVRQGMVLVVVGLFLGTLLGLGVGRLLANVLYGIPGTDPVAFLGAIGALFGVALLANLVPAGRASQLDPLVALRQD